MMPERYTKIRTDGSGKQKLNEHDSRFINVVGDRIYYQSNYGGGIYNIKTDGTDQRKLINDAGVSINVVGNKK